MMRRGGKNIKGLFFYSSSDDSDPLLSSANSPNRGRRITILVSLTSRWREPKYRTVSKLQLIFHKKKSESKRVISRTLRVEMDILTLNFQSSKIPSRQWTWLHHFQEKVKVGFWRTSISQRVLCSGLQWSLRFLANLFRSLSSKRRRCCFLHDLLTALYHKNKRPKFGKWRLINSSVYSI